jgi:hypothetical protein
LVTVLGAASSAGADQSYSATPFDDIIYFGYCSACYSGGPGLLICRVGAAAVSMPMDGGVLTIDASGGNDTVKPISKDSRAGCNFGDINSLSFSSFVIEGGPGHDNLWGTAKRDVIYGESGNDMLQGGNGDDWLYGGYNNDALFGSGGTDHLYGGSGNDFLDGGDEDDYVHGQRDNDILVGGKGHDHIEGGSEDDTFRCRKADSALGIYDGTDATTDCNDGSSERLVERESKRDPYLDWAYFTEARNGFIFDHLTTSNAALLYLDRAAGASILVEESTDMPMAGDFDRDGRDDDVAVFRSATGKWYYDHNHSGNSDETEGPWGVPGDRPVVGNFDLDPYNDDVAVFRPSNCTWYYDYDHNGTTDHTGTPWGNAGDIPIAGDFDRDGKRDDLAVFRPSSRWWYYDVNHDGTTDDNQGPWGMPGDLPVAGDFDRDGYEDDVAVFRPSNGMWYFDLDHDGDTDPPNSGPWIRGAREGYVPFAGDFDRDGYADDVGLFRLDQSLWYYDIGHDGDRDRESGPWGLAGKALCTTHKQYGQTCGPASLAIVMKGLRWARLDQRRCFRRNLSASSNPVNCSLWSPGSSYVDAGHYLSMEHIMYEGYHRHRAVDPLWCPDSPDFMTCDGKLNNADHLASDADFYQIAYRIGNVLWDRSAHRFRGPVQMWMQHGRPVCWDVGDTTGGLPWVANKFNPYMADAMPVSTSIGPGRTFVSFSHLKEVIMGFIDHNLPIMVGVEDGGHFNAVVGYWKTDKGFHVYLADPLDGRDGRPYENKPMRWRKTLLTEDTLNGKGNVFPSLMFYAHGHRGCQGGAPWAARIEEKYGVDSLCGYLD